jgi:hypothetical protein
MSASSSAVKVNTAEAGRAIPHTRTVRFNKKINDFKLPHAADGPGQLSPTSVIAGAGGLSVGCVLLPSIAAVKASAIDER